MRNTIESIRKHNILIEFNCPNCNDILFQLVKCKTTDKGVLHLKTDELDLYCDHCEIPINIKTEINGV